ncbi:MAG: DUF1829 domain-containing protein [Acidobacteria bacterium]|nr:DUF1829 domain-containing protein [Acidobacteriota bacterium]
MSTELNNLVGDYLGWLKDRTLLRQVDDWFEITTPFLDRHNDYLQIYAKKQDGYYILTDDGYTMQDLRMAGCELDTDKRLALLHQTLNGFNVRRDGDELITEASPENFAVRKHNLLQAMLAVDDLFYLAQPSISSIFFEDVSNWLDVYDIRYTSNVKLTGKSGFDYRFDFVIPKSKKHPERIVSTINNPDKKAAQQIFTAWVDTKEARPQDSEAFVFVNDTYKPAPPNVMQALRKYEIHTIPWSKREDAILALAE